MTTFAFTMRVCSGGAELSIVPWAVVVDLVFMARKAKVLLL